MFANYITLCITSGITLVLTSLTGIRKTGCMEKVLIRHCWLWTVSFVIFAAIKVVLS
jgi:hypothetical protein